MEEYLNVLLSQIRCKKAHPMIEAELRDHLESQIEANVESGMNREEAVREAVRDMGSPEETGLALDHIHRPAIAGEMIVLMSIVAATSILIHMLIGNVGAHGEIRSNFLLHTVVGFILMLLIYHMDYSFMAIWGKKIAVLMLVILFLATMGIGVVTVGGSYFAFSSGIFVEKFSIYAFMMLYVPVYGAVLYQYYGTGSSGIVKAFLWLIVPVVLANRLPGLYLAMVLFVSLSVVLSVAVWKNWFKISRIKFLSVYWGMVLILPLLLVLLAFQMSVFSDYQMKRLKGLLGVGGYINGIRDVLVNFFQQSKILGGNGAEVMQSLTDFDSTYIFTYITSSYGILIALFIVALLIGIVLKAFRISMGQRNQLGMIMGCGCGSVLLVNCFFNIVQNLGYLPVAGSFLPFFTYGGSFLITSYALMGMILSVYRHKNIVPIRFEKRHMYF